MECKDIVGTLSALPGLQVTTSNERVVVFVPAIEDNVHLSCETVLRAKVVIGPTGQMAVEFAVRRWREVGPWGDQWPVILTAEDVVFAPLTTDVLLHSPIRWNIIDAPPLVAYSEMQRDAEKVAHACERPGPINLDRLGAGLLLIRCFVTGAARFGLRPLKAVAWWQRGWRAIGCDLPLPPFRPDKIWDGIAEEAARIPL